FPRRTQPAYVDRLHRSRPGGDVPRRQPRRQLQPVGASGPAAADPMDRHRQPGVLKGGPMRRTAIVVLVGLVAAAGCDLFNNALEVQTPSNIPAGSLEVPGNAGLLVNSAIGDFECAAGAYAVMSGLITDELKDATQTADRYPYELRTMLSSDRRYAVNDCVGLGVYSPMQPARFSEARSHETACSGSRWSHSPTRSRAAMPTSLTWLGSVERAPTSTSGNRPSRGRTHCWSPPLT